MNTRALKRAIEEMLACMDERKENVCLYSAEFLTQSRLTRPSCSRAFDARRAMLAWNVLNAFVSSARKGGKAL